MENLTALVVDDDDLIRGFIREVLEQSGFDVLEASSGRTAISVLKANPEVELVVTDILMPDEDGVELIHNIQDLKKSGKSNPKVIAMSGGGNLSYNYLNDVVFLGADKTLQKPFTDKDLSLLLTDLGFNE